MHLYSTIPRFSVWKKSHSTKRDISFKLYCSAHGLLVLSAYYKTEKANMDLTCNECWEWRMTTKRPVLFYFIAHLFDIKSCIHSFIRQSKRFLSTMKLECRQTFEDAHWNLALVFENGSEPDKDRRTDGRTWVYITLFQHLLQQWKCYRDIRHRISLILLYKVKKII